MEFVLLSVICSVTVSVLLKWARNRGLDTTQMIIWNYPVAGLLTYLFFQPQIQYLHHPATPWLIYLLLAILLPAVFFALGASIRTVGIVRTEVAQRLSLVIPLLAAFSFFGEQLKAGTGLGLFIGLIAILFSIGWHKSDSPQNQKATVAATKENQAWLYPLLVFVGYGVCDILFKRIAQITAIPYTTSMFFVFALAMIVAFGYLAYLYMVKKTNLSVSAIFWGWVLGGFNFANILFYMKAHRALPDNPSVVFAGMNIGVIALGALVGVWIFKEKLTTFNRIGLLLAFISVLILTVFL